MARYNWLFSLPTVQLSKIQSHRLSCYCPATFNLSSYTQKIQSYCTASFLRHAQSKKVCNVKNKTVCGDKLSVTKQGFFRPGAPCIARSHSHSSWTRAGLHWPPKFSYSDPTAYTGQFGQLLNLHHKQEIRCARMRANNPCFSQPVRWKSRKRQSTTQSDSDDDDNDDALDADDFDAPANFKVMKIHTPSMRTDAIISNSLNVARNRLEEIFYGPGLLMNGTKMLKKSVKMEAGDYVDLVMATEEDQLKVKRVKVVKVYPGHTNTDKMTVKVRVWKAPFFVVKPSRRHGSS